MLARRSDAYASPPPALIEGSFRKAMRTIAQSERDERPAVPVFFRGNSTMSHLLMRALLAVSFSALSLVAPAVSAADEAASAAAAPASNSADIDRMTRHLMTMLPIDRIFAAALVKHGDALKRDLKPDQEACLRREVGPEALNARKRVEVLRFAEAHPTAFSDGLKVLDDGAAVLVAKIVEGTMGGEEYDLEKADPDDIAAFMVFAFDNDHADLRTLAGYGEFFGPDSGPESTIEPMMDALAADISKICAIPPEFFE